jgi:hypothetical protein
MRTEQFAKILFYTIAIAGSAGVVLLFGMYSGYYRTVPFLFAASAVQTVRTGFDEIRETSVLRPDHLIQPARYQGTGVAVNTVADHGELVLLSGFFGEDHEIRLIKRDGTVVHRWPLVFSEIFTDTSFLASAPATKWNVDTHGALAMPDGSVVFNFDYSGAARLDRCGKVLWTLPRPTHHSVERAEQGGFWIPGGRLITDKDARHFLPFEAPFVESTLMHVSDEGKVLKEIGVEQLFYDNGLEALLTSAAAIFEQKAPTAYNREIVHLNKIDELTSDLAPDFPTFTPGDLALSFRNKNLVLVVNPDTRKIKWWSVGPWIRQHDAEFRRGGTIMAFNNNTYLEVLAPGDRTSRLTSLDTPRVSNIIEKNPQTGEERILYGTQKGQEMLSVTRGKVDATPGDGLFITEFDGGRIFETDATGQIVWQYINRYDDDEVSEITEARLYAGDYFTVADWTCDEAESQ